MPINTRVLLAFFYVALTACVPIRETTYDAVNGLQNPFGPGGKCPKDRYQFGETEKTGWTIEATLKQGVPTVFISGVVWSGHTLTMLPPEITVRSLQDPSVHMTIPLSFCETFGGNSYLRNCAATSFPLNGPALHNSHPAIIGFSTDLRLPIDYVEGFQLYLSYVMDGGVVALPVTAEFRKVTRFVTRGPYGCE